MQGHKIWAIWNIGLHFMRNFVFILESPSLDISIQSQEVLWAVVL